MFRSWIEENRSSRLHMFFKIFIPKNVTNFTGKHVLELLFYKAVGLKAYSFIKKGLWHSFFL